MNKLEALIILRDKVKAGDDWCGDMPWPEGLSVTHTIQSYKGSLDAAKALHEAVLPNFYWDMTHIVRDGVRRHQCFVRLLTNCQWAENDNPARAWLLAIIEALIAQENSESDKE